MFTWDVGASGFFGQSDNVVVRLVAYPIPLSDTVVLSGTYAYTDTTTDVPQRPYIAATTYPFRVRGTSVQVSNESKQLVAGALVYLRHNGERVAAPLTNGAGQLLYTDVHGLLQGRGVIGPGDQLLALAPISATTTYTLYNTSAAVQPENLAFALVPTDTDVLALTISPSNTLMLFNLNVALEWDARSDPGYVNQLKADLQRTSELLYDWTNGQATLGDVRVIHNAPAVFISDIVGLTKPAPLTSTTGITMTWWNAANIRVYANNRMRPSANQGGIVTEVITDPASLQAIDPISPAITYAPGQARIGATWNRYGNAGGVIGEDWPRALAHELGHYLFFLNDDYLRYNNNELEFLTIARVL